MNNNKKSFMGIIKGMFKSDVGGRLPEVEVSTPMPEVKPCKKDISDPIYLLVEKLLANPELLKVTEGRYFSYTKEYNISIPTIPLEGLLSNSYGDFNFNITIGGLDLTEDESDYLLEELYDIYYNRSERYRELKHQRWSRDYKRAEKAKRVEIQKKLESM